jgi:hypothetical protein
VVRIKVERRVAGTTKEKTAVAQVQAAEGPSGPPGDPQQDHQYPAIGAGVPGSACVLAGQTKNVLSQSVDSGFSSCSSQYQDDKNKFKPSRLTGPSPPLNDASSAFQSKRTDLPSLGCLQFPAMARLRLLSPEPPMACRPLPSHDPKTALFSSQEGSSWFCRLPFHLRCQTGRSGTSRASSVILFPPVFLKLCQMLLAASTKNGRAEGQTRQCSERNATLNLSPANLANPAGTRDGNGMNLR